MDTIKIEGEDWQEELEDGLCCDNSCFICLQQVAQISEEQFNSLNFFFNYLKVNEIKEAFVCGKCGEKLAKFVTLCETLEKVRLEMDYLLGFVQKAISNSNGDSTCEAFLLRKTVADKCGEKVLNPKPQIHLHGLEPEQPPMESSVTEFNDLCGDLDDVSSHGNSATPVSIKVESIKVEGSLEVDPPNDNRKRKRATSSTPKKKVKRRTLSFKCSLCSKVFAENHTLRRHFNGVHLRIKPYMCDICGKSFASSAAFKIHKATPHHPKPETPSLKKFLCKKCEKTFDTIETLTSHEHFVHSEKRFVCDICNKEYKKTDHLKRHISSVHDKERHYCQVKGCDKSYARAASLVEHHKLDHPNLIEVPEPQKTVNYLEMIENGERVVECKLCKSKFKSVPAVKRHIRNVHGQKKFKCEHCSFATAINANFRRHIKDVHKVKVFDVVKVETFEDVTQS